MGSYNYEALHKHTPGIKRTWSGDPVAPTRGYNNGLRAVEPYANGYGNALQDRILLVQAAQAQAQAQAQVQAQAQAQAQLQAQAQVQAQAQLQAQVQLQAQAQAQVRAQAYGSLNEVTHYGLTKYNVPNEARFAAPVGLTPSDYLMDVERDRYADVYANELPIRRPIREPIREPIRGRVVRERRVREPVVRDPIRELDRSLSSPSPSPPPQAPNAIDEPPLPGMIFGCTSDTYIECMQLKLFALPAANKSEVMRVAPGTKLFLYNYRERELSGVFEATSYGDMNIMPDAFNGFFPAQVQIQCIEKCPNLPLKAFKEAMSENFEKKKNKFKYSLDEAQVRKLVTLFRQEAKYRQKEREKQQYKIMSSGLQPGLRPGYPTRNEVNLARHLPNEQPSFLQTPKWARML